MWSSLYLKCSMQLSWLPWLSSTVLTVFNCLKLFYKWLIGWKTIPCPISLECITSINLLYICSIFVSSQFAVTFHSWLGQQRYADHCTAEYFTALYSTVLQVMHSTELHCTALQWQTVHCTLYFKWISVHCVLHYRWLSVHSTVHYRWMSVLCVLHCICISVHCTLHCRWISAQCAVHFSVVHCALYTAGGYQCSVQCRPEVVMSAGQCVTAMCLSGRGQVERFLSL